jgi:lysophospholipase L1-like esterase
MKTIKTLLMLGDSLVEWGDWQKLLPDIQVINRGIAGEHVEDLAARLTAELDTTPEPDHILIMAGTNNLLMGNRFFPAIFKSMLPRLSLLCPDTNITLNSIMPMSLPGFSLQTQEINKKLKDVAGQSDCLFLNMTIPFTEQCLPITKPCFLTDGVHLSTLGYQVWANEIRRHLTMCC